jgi:arginine deiminase
MNSSPNGTKIVAMYTSTPDGYSDKHGQWNEANVGPNIEDNEIISYAHIKFQDGPIAEHGVNGVQIEDVLEVLLARMRMLNAGRFACRENSMAIMRLEEAQHWMWRRTKNREQQKVEGQDKPHESL